MILNDYLDDILENGVRWRYNAADGSVIIEENNLKSKIKKIKILGIEGSCIAFKMDSLKKKNKTHFLLKKNAKNIHKGVDAVIFCEYQNKKYILVCELKSNSPRRYENQFKASLAFIDYILSLYKKFENSNVKKIDRINVLFTTKVKKQPLRRGKKLLKKIDEHYIVEKNVHPGTSNINIRDIILALG